MSGRVRISRAFTEAVKAKRTPRGFMMVPGLFSWVLNLSMGKNIGATPNGRHAGDPISHGANPDPGFRKDGAPTALAVAVAAVQPGYGNTSPLQIDLDPSFSQGADDVEKVAALIRGHCDLGGTQVNINVLSKEKILQAHKDPVQVSGPDRPGDGIQRLLCQSFAGDAAIRGGPHLVRRMQ